MIPKECILWNTHPSKGFEVINRVDECFAEGNYASYQSIRKRYNIVMVKHIDMERKMEK